MLRSHVLLAVTMLRLRGTVPPNHRDYDGNRRFPPRCDLSAVVKVLLRCRCLLRLAVRAVIVSKSHAAKEKAARWAACGKLRLIRIRS